MCDKRTLNKLNHPAALVAFGVLQIAVGLLFILVNAANAADALKIIWYIAGNCGTYMPNLIILLIFNWIKGTN